FLEGEQRRIEFNDGSVAAHWRVTEYLYEVDYSNVWDSETCGLLQADDPALLRDKRVYGLAEMFLIEDLKALSVMKVKKRVDKFVTPSYLRRPQLCIPHLE
ncbi:hypothetical protein IQ07DRAFT_525631, partial [Pyrenochaeta sp. DS3sAY3a]